MATPSRILTLLILFILFDCVDEVKRRGVASGSQGLRGEAVQRRSLPPGDGTPPLPVGGSQRSAGAAGQHLRHVRLQPARPEHGERKQICFHVTFVDLSWQRPTDCSSVLVCVYEGRPSKLNKLHNLSPMYHVLLAFIRTVYVVVSSFSVHFIN